MVDHDLTAPDTTANCDAQAIKLLLGKSQTVTGFAAGRRVDGGSDSTASVAVSTDPRPNVNDVTNTPAINTGAYVAGYSLGGVMDFGAIARSSGSPLLIVSATLSDAAQQNAPIDLFLFNADPTNGTYTDHATPTYNKTDALMIRGVIPFSAYANIASTGSICSIPNVGLSIVPNSTQHLYGLMLVRSAPTYASASALTVALEYIAE